MSIEYINNLFNKHATFNFNYQPYMVLLKFQKFTYPICKGA